MGLIERLGKYNRFATSGFNWIIPVIENIYQVNITEQMVDAEPQEIITNDNLNARTISLRFNFLSLLQPDIRKLFVRRLLAERDG